MPSFTLTDVAHDLWVESFRVRAGELGLHSSHPWSVAKRTLRGGRRDSVDLIEVNNGALSFAVVPTRGMGLWRGNYRGDRLGWDSPVSDGPVHPAFVNLESWGRLGWLEGFDEWMVRCGLESNGPPYADGDRTYPLHGKIANIPASYVAVQIAEEPPHQITVEGRVEEAKLFGPRIRMTTKYVTEPGSNRFNVRDEFVSLKDVPCEMQLLYHWNFGPPHLEEGSRFVAPIKEVAPRDPRAQEGLGEFDVYGGPEPGFAEQAYFFDLHGDPRDGRTLAMLRNRQGDKAVALRFAKGQLPAFTLWKCTGGGQDGFVTGLEPATNYPNPKPFEKARGRVVTLPPGGRYLAETTVEVVNSREGVAALEDEVSGLQGQGAAQVHPRPVEPFSAQG